MYRVCDGSHDFSLDAAVNNLHPFHGTEGSAITPPRLVDAPHLELIVRPPAHHLITQYAGGWRGRMNRLELQVRPRGRIDGAKKNSETSLRAESIVVPHNSVFVFQLGEEFLHPLVFHQQPDREEELA
jgi:hypothetical protein